MIDDIIEQGLDVSDKDIIIDATNPNTPIPNVSAVDSIKNNNVEVIVTGSPK